MSQDPVSLKHIHCWFPNLFEFKGGIQQYLQHFLQALLIQSCRTKITLYNKLDKKSEPYAENWPHLKFYNFGNVSPILNTPIYAASLFLGVLHERPDLIICGHLNFSPVALGIHQITQTPYWVLVYGIEAWNVKDRLKKQVLQSAQKIISISSYTRNRLIEELNLNPDRISLLPCTFDVGRFHPSPKPTYLLDRYRLKPDQPIILTVARLEGPDRYKGYDNVLRAIPLIRQTLPHVHYILVGKGKDRPRIETMISELNLHSNVTLAGFVPEEELRDHYNLCDVFALPSKGEGFGIVYLEAMACGKPCLGGNQDGATDALRQGELGLLVDSDDIYSIAHHLLLLLNKQYSHLLFYQPDVLRQRAIEEFGFERFKTTLGCYLQ